MVLLSSQIFPLVNHEFRCGSTIIWLDIYIYHCHDLDVQCLLLYYQLTWRSSKCQVQALLIEMHDEAAGGKTYEVTIFLALQVRFMARRTQLEGYELGSLLKGVKRYQSSASNQSNKSCQASDYVAAALKVVRAQRPTTNLQQGTRLLSSRCVQ